MYLFRNNATSVLRQDTPAASTTITLPSGEGSRFPSPTPSDICMVTLEDRRTGQLEICQCTSRSADVLTVLRGQEGTTAQLFYAGCSVSNRMTAATLAGIQAAGTFFYGGPYDVNPSPGPGPGDVGVAGQVLPNPIPEGMQYYNTQNNQVYVWDGTIWMNYTGFVPLDGHLAMIGDLKMANQKVIFTPIAGANIIVGNDGKISDVRIDGQDSTLQLKRDNTPGGAAPTLAEGEVAANVSDLLMFIGPAGGGAGVPVTAVRFFATTAAYVPGDHVIQAGVLLRCQTATGPGPFDGSKWVSGTGGLPEAPIDGEPYLRKDGTWATAGSLSILTDAPADGEMYARKDHVWTAFSLDWGNIAGKPATFPPSPHTHTIADVSGLQTSLDAKADVTALAAETTARTNADTTLTTNLNTEITNRTNADSVLQGNINAETAARIADVDAEEAARIAADTTLQTNIDGKVPQTATFGAAVIPAGNTSQRPGSPVNGYVRYNTTTGKFEGFGTSWGTLGGGAAIADTAPSNPAPGDLWWESDTGALMIRYDDGNSSQWVQVNYSPLTTDYVRKDGSTMSGTLTLNGAASQIAVDPAATDASIRLDAPVGSANQIIGARAGVTRWTMDFGGPGAESGSNAGSNLGISNYSDTGTLLGTPISISRATGYTTFGKSVFVGGSAPPSDPTSPMLFGAVSLTRTLEFNSYVNGGLRRANATGFLGILDLNTATGAVALNTTNASVTAGADSASAMAQRMEWRANGLTLQYGRLGAITGAFNPNLTVYDTGLASAFCWQHSAAGVYAIWQADGNGAPLVNYAAFDTSGLKGMGNQRTMQFYTNGASTCIFQWHTNYYNYMDMSNGYVNWVLNGTNLMQLQVSGGVLDTAHTNASKGTAGSWIARTSDERVKEAIRDYTSGLAEILKLRPRWFQYKRETHEMHVGKDVAGFVAQEMQEALPDCVIPSPMGDEIGELKIPGMLSVDITNVTYALINAVKELTARIEALEARA